MNSVKKLLIIIIERNDTKAGRIFDLIIQGLIFISIIGFTIETLPNLSQSTSRILRYLEIFTVIIFSAEYLLRLFVSDKKLSFIFSFYGMIDLLAILPFYITSGVDLRSIRIFRLFRLFRTFKIARYNKSLLRFKTAFLSVKTELSIFLIASLFLLYFASIGIYYFENEAQPEAFASVFHSLWWAVATLTTVGYGDVYPITTGGKVFTSIIAFIGIGIIAVPTGLLASSLSVCAKKEDVIIEDKNKI